MTEDEWLSSTDPGPMLEFANSLQVARLQSAGLLLDVSHLKDSASRRKLRLFACACVRRISHLLTAEMLDLLTVAERFADGEASEQQLRVSLEPFSRVARQASPAIYALQEAAYLPEPDDYYRTPVIRAGTAAANAATSHADEELHQVALIHEIFGNPFRSAPASRRNFTPTIQALAAAAYAERTLPSGHLDPVRLAILADALEEAGITGEVVEHLRGPGPHVRGCWALTRCM